MHIWQCYPMEQYCLALTMVIFNCGVEGDLCEMHGCYAAAKVDIVQTFPSSTSDDHPSYITAGDGSICLWTAEGNRIMQFGSFPGTSPASIAVGTIVDEGGNVDAVESTKYLAACFRVTRLVDPNQFRLVPQNEAERQRREAAEVQERMIQDELMRVSRYVML